MEEKKLVPKRRYQGFTEDWDKSKLENLASFSKGKGYSKKDLTDIGHQLILYGRLYTNYETVIKKVDTYTIKQENSMLSKGREVIVPSSGETKEDIARASVILEPNIIIGGDLNVIIPSKELDSVFLALNISNGSCQSELMKRAQGSSVVHLYNEDLISVTLYFPCVKEQQKIGEFFKILDERIANQERKIAKVKALKAAYLTEMFPQEGETVPKRRFRGFEGEWNETILDSVLAYEQPTDYIVDEDSYDDSYDIPVLTAGQSFLLGYTNEKHGIKKADVNNSVIIFDDFTTSSHHVDFFFKVKSSALKILSSNSRKYSTYFAYLILKNIDYTPESHERHWISIFSNFEVMTPSMEEQQKIGEFFKNLDNQIRLEEKKLDKLQKMKKAYLEEMFV
ncbi:restriction endonuclease subunit S [Gracilibacillus thailandensis]|nr:restriction endonuclease subunit S [Gracilibacillus thailandensis]